MSYRSRKLQRSLDSHSDYLFSVVRFLVMFAALVLLLTLYVTAILVTVNAILSDFV